jgi:hypothetical protein
VFILDHFRISDQGKESCYEKLVGLPLKEVACTCIKASQDGRRERVCLIKDLFGTHHWCRLPNLPAYYEWELSHGDSEIHNARVKVKVAISENENRSQESIVIFWADRYYTPPWPAS